MSDQERRDRWTRAKQAARVAVGYAGGLRNSYGRLAALAMWMSMTQVQQRAWRRQSRRRAA